MLFSQNEVGADLSWEPPTNGASKILEYAVYLAIDNKKGKEVPQTQLTFAKNEKGYGYFITALNLRL